MRWGAGVLALLVILMMIACGSKDKGNSEPSKDCKYTGVLIAGEPGTRAKKQLSRDLIKSGCVKFDGGVCSGAAEGDFRSGQLAWKAYRMLQAIAGAKFQITISCLWHGHDENVAGTDRQSLHTTKQAFDVNYVNGGHVRDFGSRPAALAKWLKGWVNDQPKPWSIKTLPFEVGIPGPFYHGRMRTKSNHTGPLFSEPDHFHFGFK
jgi:hypothetical protein